jgi:hypothetical protein
LITIAVDPPQGNPPLPLNVGIPASVFPDFSSGWDRLMWDMATLAMVVAVLAAATV